MPLAFNSMRRDRQKSGCQGRLSAGQRDAAARLLEIDAVFDKFGNQIMDVPFFTQELQGRGRAFLGAQTATGTARTVDDDAQGIPGQRLLLAGFDADAASDARRFDPLNLRLRADALGIVAPHAGKRTSLEKHGRPDAGPVFGRHTDDLQDGSFLCLARCHDFARLKIYDG